MQESELDRAIKEIRVALRARSGRTWSVKRGTGTSYGWITIHVPPAHQGRFDEMSPQDAAALGTLLGLGHPAHHQGVNVPASSAYRAEYVARAKGEKPTRYGTPYWD